MVVSFFSNQEAAEPWIGTTQTTIMAFFQYFINQECGEYVLIALTYRTFLPYKTRIYQKASP